jgi:hypothetical protein
MPKDSKMRQNPLLVAQNLVSSRHKNNKYSEYNAWLNNFDDTYFHDFINKGLRPFLERFGYKLSLQTSTVVKYLKEWLFSIVYIKNHSSFDLNRQFIYCFHNGGMEDFDYFMFKISPDDWDELLDAWQHTELFDDSDAGHDQRAEIHMFVWRIIDLYNSKSYIKYIQLQDSDDEGGDDNIQTIHHTSDENTAYGGDRRTYS